MTASVSDSLRKTGTENSGEPMKTTRMLMVINFNITNEIRMVLEVDLFNIYCTMMWIIIYFYHPKNGGTMNQQQFPPTDVTSDDRLWAALAYVFSPLIPIVILLMQDKKDRPFIKAHNMQALVTGIVLWIILSILSCPTLGFAYILWLGMLYPAYKAYQGQLVEIPFISNFIRQQGW
jgi:uncharacterized membrane protein